MPSLRERLRYAIRDDRPRIAGRPDDCIVPLKVAEEAAAEMDRCDAVLAALQQAREALEQIAAKKMALFCDETPYVMQKIATTALKAGR